MITRPHRDQIERQLESLEFNCGKLSKWEYDFVQSLRDQLESSGSISPRQDEILNDLFTKKGA